MLVCPECGLRVQEGAYCPVDGAGLRPSSDDPLLGTMLGSFRVARLLGSGGMGRVYLAVQPEIGSRVAIKVLSHECADKRDLVERFFSEARAVNLIRHEGIVNILDLATLPDGRPFITMEHLSGAPLSTLMRARGALPLGSLARLCSEVLSAVGAAHAVSIVHRDLKPDNIFVTPQGRAKVLDFGIAKLRPEEASHSSPTRTGSILGTPHYMSPEQAQGKAVDSRTDIYAIGVIVYEAVTGCLPFQGSSLYELLRKQVEEHPIPPSTLKPDLPAAFESVILRALAKDPAARFQTVWEFAEGLNWATTGLPSHAWEPVLGTDVKRIERRPTEASGITGPPSGSRDGTVTEASLPPSMTADVPPSLLPHPRMPMPVAASGSVPRPPAKRRGRVGLVVVLAGSCVAAGALWVRRNGLTDIAAGFGAGRPALELESDASDRLKLAVAQAEEAAAAAHPTQADDGGASSSRRPPGKDPPSVQGDEPSVEGKPAKAQGDEPKGEGDAANGEGDAEKGEGDAAKAQGDEPKGEGEGNVANPSASLHGDDSPADGEPSVGGGIVSGSERDAEAQAEAVLEGDAADEPEGDEPVSPKFARFDVTGYLPTALAMARRIYEDAEFIRVDADGVRPDGMADLTLSSDFSVLYRFSSPSRSKRPDDLPLGVDHKPNCKLYVNVSASGISTYPLEGWECDEPLLKVPNCSATQVWKRAIEQGAPSKNAVAELGYWAGPGGKGRWHLSVGDVFSEWVVDAC